MSKTTPNDLTANTVNSGTFELNMPLEAGSLPAAPDETPLTQLGPYQVGREIGRGAMGTVYEAVHSQLQRTVALKVLPRELAASETRVKRFHREMAAIGRLEHPNIVMATDAGEANGLCYIAMQYIDGQDLEGILEDVGRLNPADACDIARQAAMGLQHILEQQMVHRDIKPSNIVLTKTGEVKILDLGIAKLRNDGESETAATAAGSLMGTPDYIAPEQITQCFNIDIRADIYSLGCTLYRLLSGTAPFDGPGYTTFTAKLLGHADHDPESLGDLCPEIPKPIVELVERMMAKSRDDRPATPGDVAEELTPLCEDADLLPIANGQRRARLDARPRTANAQRRHGRAKLRAPHLLWVTALAAAVIGIVAFWSRSAEENYLGTVVASNVADPSSRAAITPIALTNNETVTELSAAVHEIASSNQSIASSTAKIADTLEDMQHKFQRVMSQESILENPTTPGERYSNARLHGQRGNHAKARQSYLAYFADELPVVDPHLEFVRLLKLQEGVAGARELYLELPGDSNSVQRRLAMALLHPSAQRMEMLDALVIDEPNFAPVWYEFSREYSETRKPQRSRSDQIRERELLEEFMRLHDEGKLLKHFLDQTRAVAMVTDAEERLTSLQSSAALQLSPVSFSLVMPVGDVWKVGFGIAEPTIDIQYRVGEQGEFKSTGTIGQYTGGMESMDPRTGKPFPNTYVDLPQQTPRGKIYVQYVDRGGALRGPHALEFEPHEMRIRWERQSLEQSKRHWLQFQGDRLVFALFYTGRNAIKSITYGLNKETPDRDKSIPDEDISASNHAEFSIAIDPSVRFATIQLTYQDGTTSDVVRFDQADVQ